MNYNDITLSKLAIACLMYNSLTPFNDSLKLLKEATDDCIVLTNPGHRKSLLKWLNDWGCRNLAKKHHKIASESIQDWQQKYSASLFSDRKPIWNLSDNELKAAANAYGALKDMPGARRERDGTKQEVRIGETAASKILFAIRPEALMPWDEAMRKRYQCDGSPESYLKYLKIIRDLTYHIRDLCENKGLKIDDLPGELGRPESTVLALVNEYIYVIVTREVTRERELPSPQTLKQWAELG